jgi:hypothetical protein
VIALETEDVSIATATISIKAIQVNKKQLTQSVFRQLEECSLVDETNVRLLGVPWGYVNYFWGDQDSRATHFISQFGGVLRRSRFRLRRSEDFCGREPSRYAPPRPVAYSNLAARYCALASAHVSACIVEGWMPAPPADGGLIPKSCYEAEHCIEELEFYEDCFPPIEHLGHLDARCLRYDWLSDEEHQRNCEREIAAKERAHGELKAFIVKTCGALLPAEEILPRIEDQKNRMIDYCRRWDELMDQLRTVEQLFIAV